MSRFVLITLLCVVSASTVAANGVLDFKGFSMGGRVEAFKQKFPSFQCKPTKDEQIACDSYRETYAGFHADIIVVFFIDGRLQSFEVNGAGEDKKSEILAALKEKYGKPSSEDKQATHWELSNGNCRLQSGQPPQFQVICASNAGPPKSGKPAKSDI